MEERVIISVERFEALTENRIVMAQLLAEKDAKICEMEDGIDELRQEVDELKEKIVEAYKNVADEKKYHDMWFKESQKHEDANDKLTKENAALKLELENIKGTLKQAAKGLNEH